MQAGAKRLMRVLVQTEATRYRGTDGLASPGKLQDPATEDDCVHLAKQEFWRLEAVGYRL